jgi:hypothetical protein
MEYTLIKGRGWLKANSSAIGTGLWIKTSEHGVILDDAEIPGLVAALQNYMSRRAGEITRAAKEAK